MSVRPPSALSLQPCDIFWPISSSFVTITTLTIGLWTGVCVLNVYGKYKTPLVSHWWVSFSHKNIKNIKGLLFLRTSYCTQFLLLFFTGIIYNRVQNTGEWKLPWLLKVTDMPIMMVQFIHNWTELIVTSRSRRFSAILNYYEWEKNTLFCFFETWRQEWGLISDFLHFLHNRQIRITEKYTSWRNVLQK